jgi:glycosyltransferase involved in cell wall biosynthesis
MGVRVRSLAYLTSEYPKVSHTFVRREIEALEARGFGIARLSIRGWNSHLADPRDEQERGKTAFVLRSGFGWLFFACAATLIRSPWRFLRALGAALGMARASDRPMAVHFAYFVEACWIARYIAPRAIQHIHAHFGSNPAEVALCVGILANITYSFTVHGPDEFDRVQSTHLATKVRGAAFVVAVCSFGRSQLLRITDHANWDKVQLIRCCVDPGFVGDDPGEVSDAQRLVCVGRLTAQKGQLLLLEAMADLVAQGRQFELVLVGDGELRGEIEALIAREGLGGRVRITGWANAETVRREILSSRAAVLPSFAEGLPVALVEAMALGRPVLSTYVAGIPELVVSGSSGWLVPAGAKEELKEAICACLDTPVDVLREMGRAARSRVMERHDEATEIDRLAALFERTLARRPA